MRVSGVGLAALTGGEYPCPRGQLRGYIKNGFAVGHQALSDVPADAVAALDRPHPVGVPTAGGEHGLVAVAVGAKPALPKDTFRWSMTSMVAERLCGSTPMMTCAIRLPLPGSDDVSAGGQRYFELGIPLWSLSAPR